MLPAGSGVSAGDVRDISCMLPAGSGMLPAGSGVGAGDVRDNSQQATSSTRTGLNIRRRAAREHDSSAGSFPPIDNAVEKSLERIARKSFIWDNLYPDLQILLQLPPEQAKQAYIGVMGSYSLSAMLTLAALLGSAMNLLNPGDFAADKGGLVLAFNTLLCIICIASQCGAALAILQTLMLESTPATQIYSMIAKGDDVHGFVAGCCAMG